MINQIDKYMSLTLKTKVLLKLFLYLLHLVFHEIKITNITVLQGLTKDITPPYSSVEAVVRRLLFHAV